MSLGIMARVFTEFFNSSIDHYVIYIFLRESFVQFLQRVDVLQYDFSYGQRKYLLKGEHAEIYVFAFEKHRDTD